MSYGPNDLLVGDIVDIHGVSGAEVIWCSHLVQSVRVRYYDASDGGFLERSVYFWDVLRVHSSEWRDGPQSESSDRQLELPLGVDPVKAGLAFPTVE